MPKLSDGQLAELDKELVLGPAMHGREDRRWTLARIRVLIAWRFRIDCPPAAVWRLLHRHGRSRQCPALRAVRRDECGVSLWKKDVWPPAGKPALPDTAPGCRQVFERQTPLSVPPHKVKTSLGEPRRGSTDVSANKIQHKVNHVALVVDCSGSMRPHQSQLIRVVDEFVAGLKAESDSLGHETRISLYSFDHKVENLVWDMDVKHLPSMRGLYRVNNGATALIEASLKSLDDLGHIWEEYGEHSFLQIVVTDGEENASGGDRRHDGDMAILGPWLDKIAAKMSGLAGHWTSAILVPNSLAKRTAQNYGFPAGNIAIWDADSQKGVEEAIGTVRAAATSFLRGREQGVRGTKNLFAVGQDISVAEVRANLEPIAADKYRLLKVDKEVEIRPFVNSHPGVTYERGSCYYQLGARAQVQQNKEVIVVEKDTDRAYTGDAARSLLFGTDVQGTVSVKAGNNPKLEVYVQSRSVNRKLKPDTRLLIML